MLKFFRLTHLYTGIFIAPALLFFAFSGALQVLMLHEAPAGSDYKPAAWIMKIAQVHKNQTATLAPRKQRPGAPGAAAPSAQTAKNAQADQPAPDHSSPLTHLKHLPLKIFALLVSLGLFTSTLTGVYMAYKYRRDKLVITGLLFAGIVIPLVLLKF